MYIKRCFPITIKLCRSFGFMRKELIFCFIRWPKSFSIVGSMFTPWQVEVDVNHQAKASTGSSPYLNYREEYNMQSIKCALFLWKWIGNVNRSENIYIEKCIFREFNLFVV